MYARMKSAGKLRYILYMSKKLLYYADGIFPSAFNIFLTKQLQ